MSEENVRGRVHVIGAGIAGLAAAVKLTAAGCTVVVHEMAGQAGGRCRSFDDASFGRRIDNGNHLLLSGNGEVMAYLAAIGASNSIWQPQQATFPFVDLKTTQRWSIRPGKGRIPFWLFDSKRRAPGSTAFQHLAALKLLWASGSATVADCFDADSRLYKQFWEPLAVAVLNTKPEEAAACLLLPVLKQTLGRGEAACRPCVPKVGLSESLIDPALSFIIGRGGDIRFHQRVRNFGFVEDRVVEIGVDDSCVTLAENDSVVLATIPETAAELVPGLSVPTQYRAIVNAHFLLETPVEGPGFVGVINAFSQWVFVRGDIASVTISAATGLAEQGTEEIASRLWPEVCQVLGLTPRPLPSYRIIKEKRATIAQTPKQELQRPPTRTSWKNLMLAGDWTATGLPATIEGAVLSGNTAATAILQTR